MDRPNILFIMSDQQRYDSLGCYGCEAIPTPSLDRLAAEGVRFENCYANATICTPSRASIMTGRPLAGHGVYKLHDNLPADAVPFSHTLQAIGYRTALVGKLHLSGRVTEARERHPRDGFDSYEWCLDPGGLHFDSPLNSYASWLGENHPDTLKRIETEGRRTQHFPAEAHFSTWAADRTIAHIEQHRGDEPFFIKMSLFDPHDPYFDYPAEAAGLVNLDALAEPVGDTEAAGTIPGGLRREQDRTFLRNGAPPDREELDRERLGYYASIAFMDIQIGRVLDALDRHGLAENTLVIFVSDHGDMMGDHQLMMKGPHFYDPCARVPLLIRPPSCLEPGITVERLVQPHDIAATVLTAAGVPLAQILEEMPHSQDLLALDGNRGGGRGGRDFVVSEYRNSGYGPGGRYYEPAVHCTMLRDDRHKLTVYHGSQHPDRPQEGMLFDMLEDPLELRNLWSDPKHAQVKSRLMCRLLDWSVEMSVAYTGARGGESVTWESKY